MQKISKSNRANVRFSKEEFSKASEIAKRNAKSIPEVLKEALFSKPGSSETGFAKDDLRQIVSALNLVAKALRDAPCFNTTMSDGFNTAFDFANNELVKIRALIGGLCGSR